MRWLTTILALAVLLAACQSGPTISPLATASSVPTAVDVSPSATLAATLTPAPLSTPTASSKIPVDPAELSGVQVEFWHPWMGSLSDAINAAVTEFNQSNIWGITVKAASQGSDSGVEDALSGAAADGAVPHPLVIAAAPEAIAFDQAHSTTFVDLSPYLSDPQWGYSQQEAADFSTSFWPDSPVNGQQLSIPLLRDLSVLFYNQTWAQALGFQNPPVSTADFQAQACAAAKANLLTGVTDSAGTGGYLVNTGGAALLGWLSSFQPMPAAAYPSAPFSFNTTQSAAAFGFLRSLFDKNCAWSGRNPAPYEYFAQRKAIFYSGSLVDIPVQQKAMAAQKNNDVWTILPYPGASYSPGGLGQGYSPGGLGQGYSPGGLGQDSQPAPVSLGTSMAIAAGASPNEQLAAWLFLRWMIQPGTQARLAAAASLLPVSKSALEQMPASFATLNPQWAQAAGWTGQAQPAFSGAWWHTARPVLEDAAWQIFQPFTAPAAIPDVLKELDATVNELLQH